MRRPFCTIEEAAMTDRTFFVLCRESCRTCRGSGLVVNPIWDRYFRETDGTADPDLWARAAGFGSALEVGPEEIPCDDCEGEGRREYPIPLAEALAICTEERRASHV
jgi:hypothetical protein